MLHLETLKGIAMANVYDLPEYHTFIAAIKAAPDDDLPRLVCADWLEEHKEMSV